jgi:3-hydroxyacyl-[acyl-carrier-protein] dehydratase
MADEQILAAIPHRPPFLLIDELVECSDERAVTRRFVNPEDAWFAGHYPGNPLLPGVLICESAFQTGALLLSKRAADQSLAGQVPVLTRIQDAKFKHVVKPGDTLDIEVTLDESLGDAFFMTGKVSVGGKLALRVSFACMLAPPEATA